MEINCMRQKKPCFNLFERSAIFLMTLVLLGASTAIAQRRTYERRNDVPSQGQGDIFSSDSRGNLPPFNPRYTNQGPRVYRHGSSALLHCQGQQDVMKARLEKWYSDTLQLIAEDDEAAREHFDSDMRTWRGKNPEIRKQGEKRLQNRLERNRRWREETKVLRDCYKEWISEDCWGNLNGVYWAKRCNETLDVPGGTRTNPDNSREPRRDPLGFPSATAAPPPITPPTILYKRVCNRTLLFVNNPEQLTTNDLADKSLGHKLIYQEMVIKSSRLFFEHLNRTGSPINYGVQLVNPNKTAVQVIIQGSGFVTGYQGGEPFRQLLAQRKEDTKIIKPGQTLWLMQSPTLIPQGAFFSGVVDFEVRGGPLIVNTLGYRKVSELDGKSVYEGNLTKPAYNARVYKGIIECAELVAGGVNFTFDDQTKLDTLKVQYASRKGYINNASEWYTHSLRNDLAIKGDMFDIRLPGGTVISAEGRDSTNQVPNFGNWGVVYTLKGQVTNKGKGDRCVTINLSLKDQGTAALAWKDSRGLWQEKRILKMGNISYYKFLVRGGQTVPYEASFVLGGPSIGNLRHSITLSDGQCQ
jgi:hypothetical protein